MQIHLVNLSTVAMPRKFARDWLSELARELSKRKVKNLQWLGKDLTLVFLDRGRAKNLNFQFRKKKYPTDILSFSGEPNGMSELDELGELVLCPQVLKKQADLRKMSFKEEFGYLLIHGLLHLLGYEHEGGGRSEKMMIALQDEVFDCLRKTFNLGGQKRSSKDVHRRRDLRVKKKNKRS